MQAGCVGKCGDANVHLCREPAPRPWRERCPVLAPFPSAGRGGWVGGWPWLPPRPWGLALWSSQRLAPLLRGLRLSAVPRPCLWVYARVNPWSTACCLGLWDPPLAHPAGLSPRLRRLCRALTGLPLLRAGSQGPTGPTRSERSADTWRVNE